LPAAARPTSLHTVSHETRPTIRVAPLMAPCRLCEIRCGVNRMSDQRGPCGAGRQARVYNVFTHLGEEPELSPCLAVFLTGCNFRCAFCSDGAHVDEPGLGVVLDPQSIARRAAGLKMVEFVGGLPDVNLLAVAECAEALPGDVGVAINTNGWFTPEALDAMAGWVDWLVADLKFGPGPCAQSLAEISGYWEVLTRNLALAAEGPFRLIVRHLLMPGHTQCCTRPALAWLAGHMPAVRVNVMTGYRPLHRATLRSDSLGRRLDRATAVAEVLAWPETRRLRRLSIDGFSPESAAAADPARRPESAGTALERDR